jgi:hypothetical protein
VQICFFALPLLKVPVPVPPPNGQVAAPPGQNLIWSEPITPEPRNAGLVLEIVSSSALPSLERHAVPVEMAMTLLAVFVKPDHGTQTPPAGRTKPFPIKLEPPLPKPPFVAIQKSAALLQRGAISPSSNITRDGLMRIMNCLLVILQWSGPEAKRARLFLDATCHGRSLVSIVRKDGRTSIASRWHHARSMGQLRENYGHEVQLRVDRCWLVWQMPRGSLGNVRSRYAGAHPS